MKPSSVDSISSIADELGIKRLLILAWRDLDDPESGGSEIHAHEIAKRLAESGISVTLRTSTAFNHPKVKMRDGYRVVRKSGRYMVFLRSALSLLFHFDGHYDAIVEVWNGMPFFTPILSSRRKVIIVHHVHAEMWQMTLSPVLAKIGNIIEEKIAPIFYRKQLIVAPSPSSKSDIIKRLHFRDSNVVTVSPGVDAQFKPSVSKSKHPSLLVVGRLVPVKRHDVLIDAVKRIHEIVQDVELNIVGDGYMKESILDKITNLNARSYIHVLGHIDEKQLINLYQKSWLLVSMSQREGWGLTILEAGSCGTPCVVSNILGHQDAVVDKKTGFLADDMDDFISKVTMLLQDSDLRGQMGNEAQIQGSSLSWDNTALELMKVLKRSKSRKV